jgi:hypothetical protein
MVPLDRTTPPIELETPAGVEISPEGVIVVFPFVILLWDKTRAIPEAAEVFSGISVWDEDWELILQQSELLGYRNLETIVFLNYPRFLPVPTVFYKPSDAIVQLDALFGEELLLHTGGDILPGLDMVVAWQVPKDVFECLAEHFDAVQFKSVASMMLQNGKALHDAAMVGQGYLLVSGQLVWMAVWRNGQLLIIKSIPADDPENLTYQMLNICSQWGIEKEKIHWKVAGMVNQDSLFWHAADRFFEHFEPDGSGIVFAPDIPGHYFAQQIQFLRHATEAGW